MAIVGGVFGLLAIVVFISAIPHSCTAEARSDPQRFGKKRFGYTNIWAVALNIGISSDPEIQELRGKVVVRLIIVMALFVLMTTILFLNG